MVWWFIFGSCNVHTSPIGGYKSVQMGKVTKQRAKSCSKLYAYVVPL